MPDISSVPGLTIVPDIKIGGAPIDDKDLVDARVYLSLLETSSVVLRFSDPNMELLDAGKYKIGDPLTVAIRDEAVSTVVFSGEVTALGADQRADQRHEFLVEAMDLSHRLSSQMTPATYLQQTWSDIVSRIASRHGLTATVEATSAVHQYVLQTMNDRAFLTDIANRIGYEWFVEGTKLHFRKRPSSGSAAVRLSWSKNLVRFEARAAGSDVATKVHVHGWDPKGKKKIDGFSDVEGSAEATGSSSLLATSTFTKGKSTFGKEVHLVPGPVDDVNEAKLRAEAISGDIAASALRVSGEALESPLIKPGIWIAVADCGKQLSGNYYVTECEHVFGGSQPFRTRFKLTGRNSQGIARSTSPSTGGGWGQTGLMVGVVTNISDTEGNSQRVKVTFPTIPDQESAWARVVTLGGAADRGMEMRPEVNDEVLVGFEQGDLRRPFVIGGLLSADDKYVKQAVGSDGALKMRSIRSRAGHKIEMFEGDSKGATTGRHMTLTNADGGTKIVIGDDKITVTTKGGLPIELISGDASIKLDNGAITIKGNSVAIKATQGAKIEGATVDVKGQQKVAIDGGAQLEGAGAMVKLEASGIASVKGSLLKLN
ncbi:MAG: VgrG-related protein [Ilumatobacteraceae bacterium]